MFTQVNLSVSETRPVTTTEMLRRSKTFQAVCREQAIYPTRRQARACLACRGRWTKIVKDRVRARLEKTLIDLLNPHWPAAGTEEEIRSGAWRALQFPALACTRADSYHFFLAWSGGGLDRHQAARILGQEYQLLAFIEDEERARSCDPKTRQRLAFQLAYYCAGVFIAVAASLGDYHRAVRVSLAFLRRITDDNHREVPGAGAGSEEVPNVLGRYLVLLPVLCSLAAHYPAGQETTALLPANGRGCAARDVADLLAKMVALRPSPCLVQALGALAILSDSGMPTCWSATAVAGAFLGDGPIMSRRAANEGANK